MSHVFTAPDLVATAASDVAGIGSTLRAANCAAASHTTAVIAAADDEVSAAVASLFSRHAQQFQALSAEAAEFHEGFVQALTAGAGTYAATEAANASPLYTLLQVARDLTVFAPVERLTGRPLIGNGANGAPGTGQAGGGGGWLMGFGGNGGSGAPGAL
ncbi:PE family protein, partial [Mycobacterium conspicuum]|uniref:PE family protein n=1 Tax=Mycobacterium conspicuum TaxID=44010 RepID=UPI00111BE7DE